jgi:uncharacterized protein
MTELFKNLKPTYTVRNVEGITPESLWENSLDNISAIAFDVDGTLMPHHETYVKPVVYNTLKRLYQADLNLLIISNAYDERANELYDMFGMNLLNMDIITPALVTPTGEKPTSFRKPNPAMLEYASNLVKGEVLMVGDQLFKDVLSANRAGMPSVLVPRRGDGDDPRVKYLQRPAEAAVRKLHGLPMIDEEYPETLRAA